MGYKVIRVCGTSMRPFIKDGDCVIINPECPAEVNIGDVVAMRENQSNKLCVHRLVWKRGRNLIIKGDSLSSFGKVQPGINATSIGKVSQVIRNSKLSSSNNRWLNLLKLLLSLTLIPWQMTRGH